MKDVELSQISLFKELYEKKFFDRQLASNPLDRVRNLQRKMRNDQKYLCMNNDKINKSHTCSPDIYLNPEGNKLIGRYGKIQTPESSRFYRKDILKRSLNSHLNTRSNNQNINSARIAIISTLENQINNKSRKILKVPLTSRQKITIINPQQIKYEKQQVKIIHEYDRVKKTNQNKIFYRSPRLKKSVLKTANFQNKTIIQKIKLLDQNNLEKEDQPIQLNAWTVTDHQFY